MVSKAHKGSTLYARDGYSVVDCIHCGFVHLHPKPDPVEMKSFYETRFYDTENPDYLCKTERELEYWNNVVFATKEKILAGFLGRPGRILDIGCCGGFLLKYFAGRGWDVYGVEPGKSAYEWATKKYGIPVTRNVFEAVPLEELGQFDAVHMAFVLEHVREPQAFLGRIGLILRPGGVLCIEVPNDFNRLQEALTSVLGKEKYWICLPDHINYFTFDSLEALVKKTGYTVLRRDATFPLELFPLMGDDYIGNDDVGLACHEKRMRLEQTLCSGGFTDILHSLYSCFATKGLGREVVLYAQHEEIT